MEDQTNNRIREEFDSEEIEEIIRDVISGRLDSVHIHFFIRNLLNEQIGKIDELLKSQRDSIVERIEKAMPSHDAVQKELSLIKNN